MLEFEDWLIVLVLVCNSVFSEFGVELLSGCISVDEGFTVFTVLLMSDISFEGSFLSFAMTVGVLFVVVVVCCRFVSAMVISVVEGDVEEGFWLRMMAVVMQMAAMPRVV